MSLPSGFTFRGGFAPTNVPLLCRKIAAFLDKLPFKEIIDTRQLAAAMDVQLNGVQHVSAEPYLVEYRHALTGNRVAWGSKRTIKELKKQLARQNADQ